MVRQPQRRDGSLAEHRTAEQSGMLVTNALALGVTAQTLQTTHAALVIFVKMHQEVD